MKKLLAALLIALALLGLSACGSADDALYVYNYGEYIADGSSGIYDCVDGFEEYYEELTGRSLKVYYTTYSSNEDMYAKISGVSSGYDVIFPSDYMIERLIDEDLLLPIDLEGTCEKYGAQCNYGNIPDDFRGLYYDPQDKYSVPYTYGRVGIIYNKTMVDEEDLGGWELLWNEKYAGKILQFNNSRDGFGTVQYMLGKDVNSADPAEWEECYGWLLKQKDLIQGYVMDEIYNKLESGEAAIGPYYAGDYFTMLEVNEDLGFFYPENTNVFMDCMCIPKGAPDKEIAELFINFMLSEEPAVASAEFIYYASPNSIVYESEEYIEDMGEEVMSVLYQDDYDFKSDLEKNGYRNLDQDTLEMISELWENLKISGGMPDSVYITAGALAAAIALLLLWRFAVSRKRTRWYYSGKPQGGGSGGKRN